MILALETGWTREQIAEVDQPFREALHHALFARAVAPYVDELEKAVGIDPPERLDPARRSEFIGRRIAMRAELRDLRAVLEPPDDPPADVRTDDG